MHNISLNPKFYDISTKIDEFQQFENLIKQTSGLALVCSNQFEQLESKLTGRCHEYINLKTSMKSLLLKQHKSQLKSLSENKDKPPPQCISTSLSALV